MMPPSYQTAMTIRWIERIVGAGLIVFALLRL